MASYYLIPMDATATKPKYLDTIIKVARGVISSDRLNKRFYIVIFPDQTSLPIGDRTNLFLLESQPDIIKLDDRINTTTILTKLRNLGMHISINPTVENVERFLVQWLINENRTLASL